jgi:hypothetical protein
MTATRRPATTNEGTRRVRAEPDSDPTTGSHWVHLHQACATIQQGCTMPAIAPFIREPLWDQFAALLPQPQATHPLGCHRPRIPDRAVFDKLLQVLVFGCGYRRIADATCSATTIRRRDEWAAGRCSTWNGSRLTPTTA